MIMFKHTATCISTLYKKNIPLHWRHEKTYDYDALLKIIRSFFIFLNTAGSPCQFYNFIHHIVNFPICRGLPLRIEPWMRTLKWKVMGNIVNRIENKDGWAEHSGEKDWFTIKDVECSISVTFRAKVTLQERSFWIHEFALLHWQTSSKSLKLLGYKG